MHTSFYRSAFLCFLALGARSVFGAEAVPPLTLDAAVQLALATSPELRAADGRIAAALGRADQSRRWANPELTLNADDWPTGRGGFSEAKKLVGLSQAVPFPGKKRLDRQLGVADVRTAEAEVAQHRLELIREVKGAFFQVLAARQRVAVAAELTAVATASADTARKRVAAGAAPDQELLRAEIALELARNEAASLAREADSARQTLATLLGRAELADTAIAGALADTVDLSILDRTPARDAAHPSLAIARSARDRAELALRRARLEPYPDVTMAVAGGRDGASGTSVVQLGLSVPLPLFDRSKGRKQEATAQVAIADAELTTATRKLARDWQLAAQRLRTAAAQVASYRERILPKADAAQRLVQIGFEQGKFGLVDLLDTQRTAAEARLAYQQKLLELHLAHADVEALLAPAGDPKSS
ncbi:MAG: TolC family protein [Opitutae bacterium]|nr:TolC family protein [Opitutae bacterium]